ncbi:HesA/MoeB/ThiF family protein [Pedobacter sp. Leaf170]|uniref:HesA/MoeB/ThiF family protein n=1 Tax=Pedobacter sp. Leaf170 TaxID=2876558 RepID=UPI001E636BDB|nr:HesA/MoeB/ThiF family protein [Pedobacter sp. Leaf170]
MSERYNRQVILNGFGLSGQQKLAKAKVLVIGVGGLGCPALQYLAGAGIGTLGFIDGDRVSISNLHRQLLFKTSEVGRLKVELAAISLSALNPEIIFKPYPYFINQANILDILRDYDLVIDGTDNFNARYLINDACVLLKKPLVFAAVSGFEGQLAVFNVPDVNGISTNYRDVFPIPPEKGEILNCAENGVIGVLPGIFGTMQAAEAIKVLSGIGRPLVNKLLNYNLLAQSVYEIELSPGPAGSYVRAKDENSFLSLRFENLTADNAGVVEIDFEELQIIKAKGNCLLVDVREVYESPKLSSGEYRQFPMSEIEKLMKENLLEKNIVCICQHGIRSLGAGEQLCEKYGITKNIYSLKGGIARWKQFFTSRL